MGIKSNKTNKMILALLLCTAAFMASCNDETCNHQAYTASWKAEATSTEDGIVLNKCIGCGKTWETKVVAHDHMEGSEGYPELDESNNGICYHFCTTENCLRNYPHEVAAHSHDYDDSGVCRVAHCHAENHPSVASYSGYCFRYQIQPGDCLSVLAQRYGTTVATLCEINNIANPNYIRAYDYLLIPCRS